MSTIELQNLQKLTEELNSDLKKIRPKPLGVWILCCLPVAVLFVGSILLWIPCPHFDIIPKAWHEIVFAIISIIILSFIAYNTCRFLYKFLMDRQQENQKWQTKLIDAYGKLLEEQIKPEGQKESEDTIMKREEERKTKEKREAELNEKRHELEKAKLDYEIQKIEFQKAQLKE